MKRRKGIPRRATLKGMGAFGALAAGSPAAYGAGKRLANAGGIDSLKGVRREIYARVFSTPFVDTHEHLIEEKCRFDISLYPRIRSDDWSIIFSHYLNSDFLTAGIPPDDLDRFFSPEVDPVDKWRLIEPWWPSVRNTGYGQAAAISMRELYGVDELSGKTVARVQEGYEKVRAPGFYERILRDMALIDACHVNSLQGTPFMETAQPLFLMQDLSIVGMFARPDVRAMSEKAGIEVDTLDDWHRVIDWWFDTYGPYAVAVKSQHAYSRDIDYADVPPEKVEWSFMKRLRGDEISDEDQKSLQDHLFWYSVRQATDAGLPVKLHTGYYAGQNSMPLSRLINNAGSATDLCRLSPETTFVFMHICYPYYEELISAAKQWTNACVDMCWSWIINPVAAKDFLKKYLVTAPANKIVTFGGDYIPVEPVLGHAAIARQGIAQALSELVEEGWLGADNALALIDPIMHGNAERLFRHDEKLRRLRNAPWL